MGHFAGGLARGIARSQQAQQANEFMEAQKSLIKAQAKAAEAALDASAKKQQIINQGLNERQAATQAGGNVPTPFANAGQKPPELTEIMANAALAEGNLGDFMKAQALQQTKQFQSQFQNQLSSVSGGGGNGLSVQGVNLGSDGDVDIRMGRPGVELKEVASPDGSKILVPFNKETGQPLGSTPTQSGLPFKDQFASPQVIQGAVHKQTLQSAPLGTRNSEISDQFVVLSQTQLNDVRKAQRGIELFGQINDAAQEIFSIVPADIVERGEAAVRNFFAGIQQSNPALVKYQRLSPLLVNIVRSLGEAGAITEGDIKRAEDLIPTLFPLPDTPPVAERQLNELWDILTTPISTNVSADAVNALKPQIDMSGSKIDTPIADAINGSIRTIDLRSNN